MEWKQASKAEQGVSIPERWVFLQYYEAFNLLFRIENALRVFVYIVLKNEMRDQWVNAQVLADDDQGTISSLAKRRMSQAQTFGYLGYPVACPIMHLNSGEMTRLIVSDKYWKLFKPYFLGSKDIIKSKLDEIGSIRNSLAHFRPIRADDVDVIKQNSRHVLLGIEQFLSRVVAQTDIVPTNTQSDWYRELRTLGTDQCDFGFKQSADEAWISIEMHHSCPTIDSRIWREHAWYMVLTLRSSAILTQCPEMARDVCYLSESVLYPQMLEGGELQLAKTLSFVLSRATIESQHSNLKKSLEELLLAVAKETELVQQDHLARGQLVHAVPIRGTLLKDKEHTRWEWSYQQLQTPVLENDPPEYWGNLAAYGWEDFVSATHRYPWMPEPVSNEEMPF